MRTDGWMHATVMAASLALVLCAAPVSAQSLGEVARQESERRSQQAESGKTYTNEDLDAVESSATPPPAAPAAVAAPPTTTTTKSNGVVMQETGKGTININAPEAKNNRDENYWRRRSRDMRENLARVRANIAAAEQRLAALEQGPQTPAAARERQAAETALRQLRSEENMRNTDMAQLKTFAAGQKVPPEWLELE